MTPHPSVLASTTWKTVRPTKYQVAILPWGATEPHNYHLPFGTDIIESEYVAATSARIAWDARARVAVLPAVPFGVNTGQLDLNMTINMNPSTQLAVFKDVVDSLSRHKVRKLVLLNSHGGNEFKPLIRELTPQYPDLFISTVNWWQIVDQKKYFDAPDDHAGEMETSVMLAIAPDLVLPLSEAGPGKARPFALQALREKWAWAPRQWTKATDDTGVGNPAAANADKGKRYLEAVTRKVADYLIELAAADPERIYLPTA